MVNNKKGSKNNVRESKTNSRNGYRFTRCKGSHFIYMNRTSHKIIAVNKDLNRMVRERLIKENKLQEV